MGIHDLEIKSTCENSFKNEYSDEMKEEENTLSKKNSAFHLFELSENLT
jgi:hypothetical protein